MFSVSPYDTSCFLDCIATDLVLHGTFRMDSSHEMNHDDAWLGLPADGNVCTKCDDT